MSINELWRELQNYLTIDFSTYSEDSLNEKPSIVAVFKISNEAHPPQQDSPEIRFENIILKGGVPPNFHVEEIGSLSPTESKSYEHRCNLSDLPDTEYDLEATLSPDSFFSQHRANKFPGSGASIPISAYKKLFDEIDIHRWLNSTIKSFPIPKLDSTLAGLQTLGASLNEPIVEIREAQERLRRMATFVDSRNQIDREALSQHGNAVHLYLEEVARSLSQVRQALNSPNIQQLSGLLEGLISHLKQQADVVDRATHDLASG